MCRYIDEECTWVKHDILKAPNTPFVRLRETWHIVSQEARKESNGTSFRPSCDGQVYEFFNAVENSIVVDMLRWRDISANLCNHVLPSAVNAMVPNDCAYLLEELPLHLVNDHHSIDVAVHKQSHNIPILSPIITAIQNALLSPSHPQSLVDMKGELVRQRLLRWLALEQSVLAAVATIFALSSGPTFRSFQMCQLRYDHSPDNKGRNLYFLSNGRPILANPDAKQLTGGDAATALSFPPSATRYLCYFFWIMKPIVTSLLGRANVSIPASQWRIWVNPNPHGNRKIEPYYWRGADFNEKIINLTKEGLGFRLNYGLVRQIAHAVFREKIPSLFNNPNFTAEKILSQTNDRPLRHFMDEINIPALGNLSQKECCVSLIVSEIWQMLLGIGCLDPRLKDIIHGSHILPTQTHQNAAFDWARVAIKKFLHIPMLGSDHVTSILSREPFVLGNPVRLPEV